MNFTPGLQNCNKSDSRRRKRKNGWRRDCERRQRLRQSCLGRLQRSRSRSSRKLKWWNGRGWQRKFGSWRRKNVRGGRQNIVWKRCIRCRHLSP